MATRLELENPGPELEKWLRNRAPTRKAFAKYHKPSADQWLTKINNDAVRWTTMLADKRPLELANIRRATLANLRLCSISMGEPAPPALVTLVGLLMNVKPARGQVKNKVTFLAAARFLAENPGATVSMIKRSIPKGDGRTIKGWMAQPDFIKAVDRFKQSKKNKEFMSQSHR